MRQTLLILTFIISTFTLAAAKGDTYDSLTCSLIPDSLKTNANAVVRSSHIQMDIVAVNDVKVKERNCITVLNESGRKYAELLESYSTLQNADHIRGWLYDKDGREVEELKKNKLMDLGWSQNFFDDYRYKYFSFNYSVYPYTVVYEVEKNYNHSFWLQPWSPMPGHDVAVMNSDIVVTYPRYMAVRHKLFHFDASPVITEDGEIYKLAMAATGLKARKREEDYTPGENYRMPAMLLAADHFGMLDMKGDMTSWQDFGAFIYRLNDNRDQLPEDKKKIVHQLTDTCHSVYDKISLLYRYMQETDRYVSIQLGIGGWQTLEASFVADKGYGDCKALSNYTKALLKEAGITAYLVAVSAGRDDYNMMDTGFAFSVFNHMILCVPQPQDTVWLECTSHTLPAGYLSAFTEGRNVLLLTPSGGRIVKTPCGDDKTNVLCRKAVLKLGDDNTVSGWVNETWTGYWWDYESARVNGKPRSEIESYLNTQLSIPSYSATGARINNKNSRLPELSESMSITGSGIANKSGDRLFLSARIFTQLNELPAVHDVRTIPFEIDRSSSIADTVILQVPEAYKTMGAVKDISAVYPFGSYEAKLFFDKGTVKIISCYRRKKGIYPAAQYADFAALCRQASLMPDIVLSRKD